MFKKITLIIFLSVALGAFLILRPYIFRKSAPPRIEDRLPDADFIGRAYVLDVARETSGMLYYHKIPFRDLLSYEFILSQGKLYGLNLQNPVYFFGNERGDWGALVQVTDSSKIYDGIERLGNFIDITDTLVQEQHVYQFKKLKSYLYYDKNYLFIYKGKNFSAYFDRVHNAKLYDIQPAWRSFLKEKQFKGEKLVLFSNWKKLKDYGLETVLFAHDSDSTSFSVKTYARNSKNLSVKMKDEGLNLLSGEFTSKMLNIHLDISKLREDPTDPLYKWIEGLGRKISFPTKDFLKAWEGDLSMRQGGFQLVKETYIESELDDDFNVTEVEKTKEVKVPGFSLMFSVNAYGKQLLERLLAKGILTQEDDFYRFLFSPQLKLSTKGNYFIFHSGQFVPKTESSNKNSGIWTKRGTRLEFTLDSLSRREVFGTIYIPVDRIISRNRFF
jgi:hypothetical protein